MRKRCNIFWLGVKELRSVMSDVVLLALDPRVLVGGGDSGLRARLP
jgi:hypothetical protein